MFLDVESDYINPELIASVEIVSANEPRYILHFSGGHHVHLEGLVANAFYHEYLKGRIQRLNILPDFEDDPFKEDPQSKDLSFDSVDLSVFESLTEPHDK